MRSYRRLHDPLLGRITRALDDLVKEPRPADAARLAGQDDYRIRVGDYRIVYAVDEAERLIIIARIAHRREVYRR